ncbi:MAG TPA: hypothetical protein VKF61_05190 [Candidatus Polarisedimenticolia bacterium]|nr:hypothetical protein [Candidatus Polarisedimenticolia bacterium]
MPFPPPPARSGAILASRCPECGSGDLFGIEIRQRDGAAWRGVYCAGTYDRDRRRFLQRGCGYAGESIQVAAVDGGSEEATRPSSGAGPA